MKKLLALSLVASFATGIGHSAQAAQVTLEEVTQVGLEYILSEYTLDQLQYTACGLTLAKKQSPANFDKVKRDFLSVFSDDARAKVDREFYGNDMAKLKDAISYKAVMETIQKAKKQGKDMNAFCEREVDAVIKWNQTAQRNWNGIKAKLAE